MKKRIFAAILIIMLMTCTVPVWARAGGGGGSSSGGGGGSSSSHTSASSHGSSGRGNISGLVMQGIFFIVVTSGGTILLLWKARVAKGRSRRAMEAFARLGGNWDAREVQRQAEEAYYQIQECWRRMDINYGAPYLSPELQAEFDSKIQWMAVRNEEVVQKKVRLLKAMPVFVQDAPGEEQDVIWYLIQGKMTGYYIDKNTRQIVRGNPKPEMFIEYWKFVYRNKRWVLHEIKQQDEIDIESFMNETGVHKL